MLIDPGNSFGVLVKPHGYKGELVLKGEPGILKDLKEGMPLFIIIAGQRVPFFIKEISMESSFERGIVKFEFIESEEEARKFTGCALSLDLEAGRPPENTGSNLVGYSVTDKKSGKEYRVIEFIDYPENPILVLRQQKEELLLPLNADYILKINHVSRTIQTEMPEGLE